MPTNQAALENDHPISREEDTETLLILHSLLRKAITKHQSARLELFYYLQFQNEETNSSFNQEALIENLKVTSVLEKVTTEDVSDHSLYQALIKQENQLLSHVKTILNAVHSNQLSATVFRQLLLKFRRFDIVASRFEQGITSSLTNVDELTGLLNRVAMELDIEREQAQAKRTGKPLSLAMLDADLFKVVNDDYGHHFGDYVLETLADCFEENIRPRDRAYRYGGEEFLILLPETTAEEAHEVMERLRKETAATTIESNEISIVQTVSIGVALLEPDEAYEQGIERADKALYQAKENGRNQVVVFNGVRLD